MDGLAIFLFLKGGGKMKRILIGVLIGFFLLLAGCKPHISELEKKMGPPGKVEQIGDEVHYYWYMGPDGKLIYKIITNSEGKIIYKTKYWKQPES